MSGVCDTVVTRADKIMDIQILCGIASKAEIVPSENGDWARKNEVGESFARPLDVRCEITQFNPYTGKIQGIQRFSDARTVAACILINTAVFAGITNEAYSDQVFARGILETSVPHRNYIYEALGLPLARISHQFP